MAEKKQLISLKVDPELYSAFKEALQKRDVAGDPPRRNVSQELTWWMIQVVRQSREKEGEV